MKKLFLLLATSSIAMVSSAQMRVMSVMTGQDEYSAPVGKKFTSNGWNHDHGNKTTATGSRWYNYAVDVMDTAIQLTGLQTSIVSIPMWQDTTQSILFTGASGLRHVNMVSVGSILDPSIPAFNDSDIYVGQMKLTNSNAYVVDSIRIFGVYNFNPSKTAVKDTIRLSFLKGLGAASAADPIYSGNSTSGGHYGTATFLDLRWDSVYNYARNNNSYGTATDNKQDIILDNSGASPAWGDTLSNGIWATQIALTTPLSASAKGFVGMSISFVSGDATLPTTLPGDTIVNFVSGVNKYNSFFPLIRYASNSAGDPQWAPYSTADSNVGLFKKLPGYGNGWTNTYVPTWAWSSSSASGAATSQYPEVEWHITCATCSDITNIPPNRVNDIAAITKVEAFPNPANNALNIPFTLGVSSDVSVSMSNMMGQVVASQNFTKVTSGRANFNTSAMPAGIYFYTVVANGQRSTGRVVVAH